MSNEGSNGIGLHAQKTTTGKFEIGFEGGPNYTMVARRLFLLFLVGVISAITLSCKKKSSDPPIQVIPNVRLVKQVKYNDIDFVVYKKYYTYQNNRLQQCVDTTSEKRSLYHYSENQDTATVLDYYLLLGDTLKNLKTTYIYKNQKIQEKIEEIYSDDAWIKSNRLVFLYTDNKLTAYDFYNFIANEWLLSTKVTYTYTATTDTIRCFTNGGEKLYSTYNLRYDENHRLMNYSIYYMNNEVLTEAFRNLYTYDPGNYLESIEITIFNQTTNTWNEYKTIHYTYSSGVVANEITTSSWPGVPTRTTYEYEDGTGNLKSFIYPDLYSFDVPIVPESPLNFTREDFTEMMVENMENPYPQHPIDWEHPN